MTMYTVENVNVKGLATPEVAAFLGAIEASYLTYFPKGWIRAELRRVLGDNMIRIRCGVQNRAELFNGYEDNDPGDQIITINLPDDLSGFNQYELVTEGLRNSMRLKPTDKYHVYGSERFGYRKGKGTPDKLLKHFDKYFAKCRAKIDQWKKDNRLAHNVD